MVFWGYLKTFFTQGRKEMAKKKKQKKLKGVVAKKNRDLLDGFTITISVKAERKMTPEELEVFLRESSRGTGIHEKSNKACRRKNKQQLKKEE
jgi:hypothetical protein